MTDAALDVVGIGNAIVDVLAHADDNFLRKHGLAKGAMTLVDEQRADEIYSHMGPGVEVSGACVGAQINIQSVVSWLVIGLGCTLGGQFWFDLLRQVVRVKTAASGLNSDLKRATGATGGRAQGSGPAIGAGQVA